MKNKSFIIKLFLITILMYIMLALYTITLKNEVDLSSLKNGPLILVLFYGQLILLIINIIINRKEINISSEMKRILDFELIVKSVIILIYNIILPNLDYKIGNPIIYSTLLIAFIINIGILLYLLKYKDNLPREKSNLKAYNSNYSLSGQVLYIIAIVISIKTTQELIFKICIFILAINIISNNLKRYYDIKNIINKINLSLIIGALVNISMYCYIFFMSNELDKKDIINIRDIAFIISVLFLIPYLKKSQFSNR